VISVTVEPNVNLSRLDPGEQAAIFLAQSLKADLLLIDERLGRQAAIGEGLEIMGIVGILDEAAEKNLIDIRLAITQLQQTNFRVSPRLVKQLLDHHLHPYRKLYKAPTS
jgi:predicted nucleic acid-binding protein